MGGGILPLPIGEIKTACDVYDATLDDFEKVLKIEQAVFPLLQEKAEEKTEQKKKSKSKK